MKELVLLLSLPLLDKKFKYVMKHYENYQIVKPQAIREAMEFVRVDKTNKVLYLIQETMTRALMICGRPIVVIDKDAELESIFVWKRLCVEHGYKIKLVILDVPLEESFASFENRTKESLKKLLELERKFEQLKGVGRIKNQNIFDEFVLVKLPMEEKKDEVL